MILLLLIATCFCSGESFRKFRQEQQKLTIKKLLFDTVHLIIKLFNGNHFIFAKLEIVK